MVTMLKSYLNRAIDYSICAAFVHSQGFPEFCVEQERQRGNGAGNV